MAQQYRLTSKKTGQKIVVSANSPEEAYQKRDEYDRKTSLSGAPIDIKSDAQRMQDFSAASAATQKTAPYLQTMRELYQNPDFQPGGGQPLREFLDEYLPGEQINQATGLPGLPGVGQLLASTSRQKDYADMLRSANTQLTVPLAAVLKPVSNVDIQMIAKALGDPTISREAGLASVQAMTREQSEAPWRARKAQEWQQAYGSLSNPADRPYDTLAAQPGELFDQYFARWAEHNRAAMNMPEGRVAQYRPASRAGEVDVTTGRLRAPAPPPPQPRQQRQRTTEDLLREFGG